MLPAAIIKLFLLNHVFLFALFHPRFWEGALYLDGFALWELLGNSSHFTIQW